MYVGSCTNDEEQGEAAGKDGHDEMFFHIRAILIRQPSKSAGEGRMSR